MPVGYRSVRAKWTPVARSRRWRNWPRMSRCVDRVSAIRWCTAFSSTYLNPRGTTLVVTRRGPRDAAQVVIRAQRPYRCGMWRDLGQYLRALWNHFGGLATGAALTVALLVWQYVLKRGDIPMWVLGVAVGAGLFISGFQAWREEHAKIAHSLDGAQREERIRLRGLADKMVDEYVG